MADLSTLKVRIGSEFSDIGIRDADAKVTQFTSKVSRVGDTAGRNFSGAGTHVKGFGTDLDTTGTRATGLGSKLSQVGQVAGGFLAANVVSRGFAAFTGFISQSIEASSNLGESINAVNKVFGSSSQQVLDWGKSNAVSFGLSQRAFNELATPLGAGLRNAGLSMDQVATTTINLTKRAADMASVFNTTVPDALQAIQAGLRGEADPLERYGVGLSAAKVQAQALADTGKTTAESLTTQELALARVKLIMDQTNTSAGDFQSTSDGYANSQRIAAAKTEELQAKIGDKLVPVMLKLNQVKLALVTVIADRLLPVLTPLINFASEHPALLGILAGVIGGVLVIALTAWAVSATAAAFATLGLTAPILAVIAVLGGIAAAGFWIGQNWDWLAAKAGQIWESIKAVFSSAWEALKVIVSAGVNFVAQLFLNWTLPGIIIRHWDSIRAGAVSAWNAFTSVLSSVVQQASSILSWFGTLPGTFASWFTGIVTAVSARTNSLVSFVAGLPRRILSALGNVGSLLWNSGIALVSGFWDGIIARWGQMVDWVRRGMANLRDLWPFSPARKGPFSGRGYVTYSGAALTSDFAESIAAGTPAVLAAASTLIEATAGRLSDTGGRVLVAPTAGVVTPSGVTEAARKGGLAPLVLELRSGGTQLEDLLIDLIKEAVRKKGGDPQIILGSS